MKRSHYSTGIFNRKSNFPTFFIFFLQPESKSKFFYLFFLRQGTTHPCRSLSTKQYSESSLMKITYTKMDGPVKVISSLFHSALTLTNVAARFVARSCMFSYQLFDGQQSDVNSWYQQVKCSSLWRRKVMIIINIFPTALNLKKKKKKKRMIVFFCLWCWHEHT